MTAILPRSWLRVQKLQIKCIIITVENTTSKLTILPIFVSSDNLINFVIVLWTLVKISRTKDKLALELHTVLKLYHWSTKLY